MFASPGDSHVHTFILHLTPLKHSSKDARATYTLSLLSSPQARGGDRTITWTSASLGHEHELPRKGASGKKKDSSAVVDEINQKV